MVSVGDILMNGEIITAIHHATPMTDDYALYYSLSGIIMLANKGGGWHLPTFLSKDHTYLSWVMLWKCHLLSTSGLLMYFKLYIACGLIG